MNLTDILKRRYATKKFDSSKKISSEDFQQIKAALRLSPSSVNSQPWHFFIAQTDAAKQRFMCATQPPYNANHSKILDASHVILFCVKTDLQYEYLETITKQEQKDGRFPTQEAMQAALGVRKFYADLHLIDKQDVQCWMQNQVYLNIGNLLLSAAILGIDAVPIEGVDLNALDLEFSLNSQKLTAVAVVALGYGAEDDFNAALPKSRLPEESLITFL